MNKIAGVDYSLTSPAICVWKSEDDRIFDFDSCDVYYLETTSRQRTATHGILNLHSEPYPDWETEEQRHDLLSDWAMSILQGCEVFIPSFEFCTDNAAMIAMSGYFMYQKQLFAKQSVTPMARINLNSHH